ncbi:MAG: hypothetical protein A3G74_02405, partial [Sulfurimonas sp. RIFCSPLOWO2_12_FULL_34_6]
MKILYDYQIFSTQRYGGISRYFYELIKEFDSAQDIEIDTSLLISDNYYISDKKFVQYLNFLQDKDFYAKKRFMSFFNNINSINRLKSKSFDLFHPTYYNPYFLKYLDEKPFVLTVYDMIHEKFQEMFPSKDNTSHNKRLLVEKATKIIAISKSTKADLIELFATDESKIEVVYLGNSMFYKSDIEINISIPKKYILFVGSRGGYKNFNRFIQSITELLQEDKELFVTCIGGGKFKTDEAQLFRELNISEQVIQYDLDDDMLAYFYKNAMLFVFPSLYEGFGMPILESFACGCPLVCSNTSSLPEIAFDGAA